MANIITCKTKDGKTIQYVDEVIGSGSMKDVYFSPDKSYVVAFYHKPQNEQARERINMITGGTGRIFLSRLVEITGKVSSAGPLMWLSTLIRWVLLYLLTSSISSSDMVPKTMISSGSKDEKRKGNGLPARTIRINFWIRVNVAIRLTI
jgi:hypothetical protein